MNGKSMMVAAAALIIGVGIGFGAASLNGPSVETCLKAIAKADQERIEENRLKRAERDAQREAERLREAETSRRAREELAYQQEQIRLLNERLKQEGSQ